MRERALSQRTSRHGQSHAHHFRAPHHRRSLQEKGVPTGSIRYQEVSNMIAQGMEKIKKDNEFFGLKFEYRLGFGMGCCLI